LFWLACLLALPAAAQTDLSTYQGPGVLSPGVGDIGSRSGQQVDLRFWGGVNAVGETNLQPLITDSKGNLIHVPTLYGVEANIGAYGVHSWQHAQLGVNYVGDYRHFSSNSSYDGTNQTLALGYTVQYSSRITLDLRGGGSTLSLSNGPVASAAVASGYSSAVPLFDTRVNMLDVAGSMTYTQSPRTSYTFGGGASAYYYQAAVLTSYSGYNVSASMLHRVSLSNSVGAMYTYAQQVSGDSSFNLEAHTIAGQYFATLGRVWTLNVTAGASVSQVHQAIPIQLDPAVFGVSRGIAIFNLHNTYPSGSAELRRQFQRASAFVNYTRAVGGSNGFFLGTRTTSARAGISYTGVRKWNFGIDGNYQSYMNLGQNSVQSTWYGGGAGFTYEIVHSMHLVGRYDAGHYDFGAASFRRTTQAARLGVSFSPGNVPLSLW